MSGSLSIFQKLCPSCASSVPVSSARCDCGHTFEALDGSSRTSAEEAALRDEELYENYLIARATQAQEAAHAAQDALTEDPDSPEKISAAELAREVARSIQSDLAEQRLKVEALRAAVRTVTPAAPTPPEAPVANRPAVATPATRPSQTALSAKHKAAPVPLPAKPATTQPAALPLPVTVSRQAVAALEAIKKAKAREMVARPKKTSPAVRETPVSTPKPVNNQEPTRPVDVPTVTNVPPPTFRAEQAAKAEKVMGAHNPTAAVQGKECPNCTASVPTTTTRCRCGFAFASSGDDMPTLTLCTGDFTALRNSLNLNLRGRSGRN